ncbi:MAG: DNA helicase RecQ [Desulfobacterium sp.]|nr:DNA helicase RecQ [Desulfobacterium sp.]MBU3949386.1 DNA helicase RecQ [Pseudomonadota bacterium]
MTNKAKSILGEVFGYSEFRSHQKKIIENVINKKDTLVIMPTGGGKSLCYQIPALIFKGLTVVVSPLISLMKDQVEQLSELGVSALFLNSTLSGEEYSRNVELLKKNEVKLLYLAPENLLSQRTLSLLSSLQIDCLAIDEAHCISEWGHDFRPEYRKLADVRSRFPSATCIALTATATQRVREDIKSSLGFDVSNEFIASFDRQNLYLHITPKNKPVAQTMDFLSNHLGESGIIYCFSRRQVDSLYEVLEDSGYSVRPYHAGLSDKERADNQDLFIKDDVQIIVATIAFGMGINKPNVRFVIHFDLPKNIETYYQEIGRAGRDGLKAYCLLLFGYGDIQKIKYFINQKSEDEQRTANIHLNALLQFTETEICRRRPLLAYFGEEYHADKCNMCDNCLAEDKKLVDITILAQKFLSCVKRTDEMFGINHIIDILRGSQSQKICNFEHEKLSTYGIGKEYTRKQWFHLARQFINKGLMIQDAKYGGLKLTDRSYDVFKGKEAVFGMIEEEHILHVKKKEMETEYDYDRVLFEKLRIMRKELADNAGVPPYVIFSDKTLIEMSAFYPRSEESLLHIHGVGAVKHKKYGACFLDIIDSHCKEHRIEIQPVNKQKVPPHMPQPSRKSEKKRYMIIGETYNMGKSVDQIMEMFNIKKVTAIDHLYNYLQSGQTLRSDGILEISEVSSDQHRIILETFHKFGTEFLKPVFDALEGRVSYDELKIFRLYCISMDNTSRDFIQ